MYQLLFELLQVALGNSEHLSRKFTVSQWNQAYIQAKEQVGAVCFGAIEKLSPEERPPSDLLMQWIALAESQRQYYQHYKKVLASLASFYRQYGVKMLLLKGYGLSLDYPVPELRPAGDIDIYLIPESGPICYDGIVKEYADQAVECCWGIEIGREYKKHSHFLIDGVVVENHDTFIDTDKHKSNLRFQSYLENLLVEKTNSNDNKLNENFLLESPVPNCYLPSATWNALFLLRHAGEHFATEKITLRHVLDLGIFFQSHSSEIDWDFVLQVYEKENMIDFYNAISTICTRFLWMNGGYFYGAIDREDLANKVLRDIFTEYKPLPMSNEALSKMSIIHYGVVKSLRWWKNRWKYKMVYNENILESFWGLAVNRLNN